MSKKTIILGDKYDMNDKSDIKKLFNLIDSSSVKTARQICYSLLLAIPQGENHGGS